VAVERFGETVVMEELMAVQVFGVNRNGGGLMIESHGYPKIFHHPPLQKHRFQKSIRKRIKR
jgi:hypothetical protein